MASVNKVFVIGNLGKDAEIKYTPLGKTVTSFSLAVNEKWTGSDGQPQERTDWFNVEIWGDGFGKNVAKYLTKGKQVHVEGKLRIDRVEKDGTTAYYTKIVGSNVTLLGGPRNGENHTEATGDPEPAHDESEIPF